uniref:Uncharacterized protein n=1 Tax=Anopheles culicifacies TaxID=139723 RepID=A0A182M9C3_9DIPT
MITGKPISCTGSSNSGSCACTIDLRSLKSLEESRMKRKKLALRAYVYASSATVGQVDTDYGTMLPCAPKPQRNETENPAIIPRQRLPSNKKEEFAQFEYRYIVN